MKFASENQNNLSFKKIKVSIFIVLAFFVMTSVSWAATYYADKTAGKDSNAGTQSQPWQNCPGMGGWTGNATLKAGDTVYFDSADTWSASSGTALLAVKGGVTYDGATWGSGTRATFMATRSISSTSDGVIRISDDNSVYETVVTGFMVNINNQAASGIMINRMYSKNLTGATKRVENCVVHDINPTSMSYGILVGNETSTNTENVEILNNIVYNTPRSGVLAYERYQGGTGHVDNLIFRGNEVYNAGLSGSGTAGAGIDIKNDCNNIIVEQNYVHDNKLGIAVTNDNGYPAPNNVTIRHNQVTKNSQAGILIDNDQNKDADIYGNVIHSNSGPGLLAWSTLSGNVTLRIYNNTFYHNSSYEIDLQNPRATFSVLELKNNIFDATGQCVRDSGADIKTHSDNIYYDSSGGTLLTRGGSSYTASGIVSGYEATSITTNPNYTNAGSRDFSLKSSSPAIDAGVDLGLAYDDGLNSTSQWTDGVVTLDRDLYGSGWDIGAYELGNQDTLNSPTNLRIINPN